MSAARAWWKITYRAIRIAKLEAYKAHMDMILYGTGAVQISDSGEAKHVPFLELNKEASPNGSVALTRLIKRRNKR